MIVQQPELLDACEAQTWRRMWPHSSRLNLKSVTKDQDERFLPLEHALKLWLERQIKGAT